MNCTHIELVTWLIKPLGWCSQRASADQFLGVELPLSNGQCVSDPFKLLSYVRCKSG
jgi:hypothetical protein